MPDTMKAGLWSGVFRSIATLSLSFGLVSIPVKVYSATESSAALRFKLLSRGGRRVRRQYVADEDVPPARQEEEVDAPVETRAGARAAARAAGTLSLATPAPRRPEPERAPEPEPEEAEPPPRAHGAALAPDDIVKGYEFEKGRFVTFTAAELKALAEASRPTVDIVSFIPEGSVDPIHYDKPYYLAPDQRGSKPYSLLHAAMRASGRCALAKWAWRGKEYVVQIRPAGTGFVLQQLLYAEEVRDIEALGIELAPVGEAELALALRLIEQIADDSYDPRQFVDEEKQRILAAVERKIAGRKVVAPAAAPLPGAQVIDLIAALRASLGALAPTAERRATSAPVDARERKPARRAAKAPAATAPPIKRARGRQSGR